MKLDSGFRQLTEIAERRDMAHRAFLQQFVLTASALLGLSISLFVYKEVVHTTRIHSCVGAFFQWFLPVCGMLLQLLSILFALIALYGQVQQQRRLFRGLSQRLHNAWKSGADTFEPFVVNLPRIYDVLLVLAVVFLAAGLCMTCAYVGLYLL